MGSLQQGVRSREEEGSAAATRRPSASSELSSSTTPTTSSASVSGSRTVFLVSLSDDDQRKTSRTCRARTKSPRLTTKGGRLRRRTTKARRRPIRSRLRTTTPTVSTRTRPALSRQSAQDAWAHEMVERVRRTTTISACVPHSLLCNRTQQTTDRAHTFLFGNADLFACSLARLAGESVDISLSDFGSQADCLGSRICPCSNFAACTSSHESARPFTLSCRIRQGSDGQIVSVVLFPADLPSTLLPPLLSLRSLPTMLAIQSLAVLTLVGSASAIQISKRVEASTSKSYAAGERGP